MPYKFTNDRRHKFDKAKYRLRNWPEYEQGLKNRGSLTVWFSDEAIEKWKPNNKDRKRGGQPKYSDLAIEAGLTLKIVYSLALRQTEGFLESIVRLLKLDLEIPDHSTLSRRSQSLKISSPKRKFNEPVVVIVDSTGLKLIGAGEWQQLKWGLTKRRSWRKLHLAIDEKTGEILSSSLTTNEVGDITELPNLIDQIDDDIDSVVADGAYDSDDGVLDSSIITIIPPRKDAVPSRHFESSPTIRDEHLIQIESMGRMFWQKESGYNKRCLVETAMFRYKKIIGPSLYAKNFKSQKTEANIACKILNKMNNLGMPDSYRV